MPSAGDVSNYLDIITFSVVLVLAFIGIINGILVILELFAPNRSTLIQKYIQDLEVCVSKFFSNEAKQNLNKIKFKGNLTLVEAFQKLEKEYDTELENSILQNLREQFQNEKKIVSKVIKVEYVCRFDPSEFTILSIISFRYKFLVIKCENLYYFYFYNYSYAKPVVHTQTSMEKIHNYVIETINKKTITVEKITEIEFISDNVNLISVLIELHMVYLNRKKEKYLNYVDRVFLEKCSKKGWIDKVNSQNQVYFGKSNKINPYKV
ncbi:hypothetical protein BpHYR1_019370 [Brachionus plicatilis]|uniref:Uncharacterized protein n=1 Tax=Brachionus plicatilis TaxID=10195 RepID=A0A3M7R330_BRAPC|nr:hypothetical protein BpHYR1_019370 [Brachionus plicatilis]